MKRYLAVSVIMICLATLLSVQAKDVAKRKEIIIKNSLFSVSLPQDLKEIYKSKVKKDSVRIYHKESEKAGFIGFAFGVKAFKNPSDHAFMPGSKKIGELTDKKGNLYDMVLIQPTDVQYDYTKSPEAPESYMLLYKMGEKGPDIEGIRGSKYYKNQGMKGEDLYKDILKKHITAINEKWDSARLEKENMSVMYNVMAASGEKVLDKTGYAYYDVNGDGIDELFIGEISEGEWKGIIYDMYTMVDRKPAHVTSGWSRNRYFVCDDAFICNDYSDGANASGTRVYFLTENSTELFPQVSFKYDGYENQKQPWFLSYDSDKWENVSEEAFKERKKVFEKYERFDYTPLSKVK